MPTGETRYSATTATPRLVVAVVRTPRAAAPEFLWFVSASTYSRRTDARATSMTSECSPQPREYRPSWTELRRDLHLPAGLYPPSPLVSRRMGSREAEG